MKSHKETIIYKYFIEKQKPTDIAKELNISKSAVSQVLQKNKNYVLEKERRKEENYKKHIKNTEEGNRKRREINQLKNNADNFSLKEAHNQATAELSKKKRLTNMAYRDWNKSAFTYNEKRKGYEFRKELGRSYDVPKFIKVEV